MEPLNALLPLLSAGILLVVWLSVIRDERVVVVVVDGGGGGGAGGGGT